MSQVKITRDNGGMRPVSGELMFACPNFLVIIIDGRERILKAVDGKPNGFTITHVDTNK